MKSIQWKIDFSFSFVITRIFSLASWMESERKGWDLVGKLEKAGRVCCRCRVCPWLWIQIPCFSSVEALWIYLKHLKHAMRNYGLTISLVSHYYWLVQFKLRRQLQYFTRFSKSLWNDTLPISVLLVRYIYLCKFCIKITISNVHCRL